MRLSLSYRHCTATNSRRWLAAQDRLDEAALVLSKYHGEGEATHPMVLLQLGEMKQQIKLDASDKRWWDYRGLANSHSARRRLICVLGMAVFGQISGNSVTSYYLVVVLVSKQAQLLDGHLLTLRSKTLESRPRRRSFC